MRRSGQNYLALQQFISVTTKKLAAIQNFSINWSKLNQSENIPQIVVQVQRLGRLLFIIM
jgi:hypothetical protein